MSQNENEKQSRMNRWRGPVAKRAEILGGLLLLPTVAGFLGSAWWVLDLTSHFRFQYAVAGLFLLGLAMLRPSRAAALPAAAALVNIACVVPVYFPDAARPTDTPPLSVLSYNVHTVNEQKEAVCEAIARSGADVVLLFEVSSSWLAALEGIEGYEVVIARPAADNFGIAALARTPVSTSRVLTLSDAMVPSVELIVPWHDREIALLGTHPVPPLDAHTTRLRNQQLANIAVWSAEEQRPHAVLGDLNVTRWSPVFAELMERGQLVDAARGFVPTWPYGRLSLAAPLRIPIDHALHSRDLTAVLYRTGEPNGSDHRPVRVALTYTR